MKNQRQTKEYDIANKSDLRKQAYFALTLVKRLGRSAGYSPQMANLLDYYLSYTQPQDWQKDNKPIVFQSLCRTAYDFSLSIRQIQRIEAALAEKGLIKWYDSPNNKRYGHRDKNGNLIKAYGVDLKPLLEKLPELERLADEKKQSEKAWHSLKKSIHMERKAIFNILKTQSISLNKEEEGALHAPIRPNVKTSRLNGILSILISLTDKITSHKNLPNVDKNVVHKKSTNNCNNTITKNSPLGLEKITLPKIKTFLSYQGEKIEKWEQIIRFSEENRTLLGINDNLWKDTTTKFGKITSSLLLLLVHRGCLRSENKIYNPYAYFVSLIKLAEEGSLFLDKSFY